MKEINAGKEPRARRRGRKLPAAEKRMRCVSVRLNDAELAELDAKRGRYQRGEWLRIASLDRLPALAAPIPAINLQAYQDLARLAANLNQLQRAINAGQVTGSQVEVTRLAGAVAALRQQLVGARSP
jgi:hypothetical protein